MDWAYVTKSQCGRSLTGMMAGLLGLEKAARVYLKSMQSTRLCLWTGHV